MNEQTYEPMDIANYLVRLALKKEKVITNLKLQKILFFVNAKYLLDHDGNSLMNESFQRWTYGPVMQSVYENFRGFGSDQITKTQGKFVFNPSDPFNAKYEDFDENVIPDSVKKECGEVFDALIDYDPFVLVKFTHSEDLWSDYKKDILNRTALPYNDQEIFEYFKDNPKEKIWETDNAK